MTETLQKSPNEFSEWVRKEFQNANKYLASKGLISNEVSPQNSRYLAPMVAVWQLKTTTNEQLWVITGDVPSDHFALSAAVNAREAMRAFSFRWQMNAENLLRAPQKTKAQVEYAQYLIASAERLYQVFEDEKLWQEVS